MDDTPRLWIHFRDDLVCFESGEVSIHFKLQDPSVEDSGVPFSNEDSVVHITKYPQCVANCLLWRRALFRRHRFSPLSVSQLMQTVRFALPG
jgi:hypothetical protein